MHEFFDLLNQKLQEANRPKNTELQNIAVIGRNGEGKTFTLNSVLKSTVVSEIEYVRKNRDPAEPQQVLHVGKTAAAKFIEERLSRCEVKHQSKRGLRLQRRAPTAKEAERSRPLPKVR